MQNIVGIDWSETRGKPSVMFDGKDYTELLQLGDVFSVLNQPTTVVLESTFESYRPDERDGFVEKAAKLGHEVRVVNGRCTDRTRRALGEEKSDQTDARIIYERAISGAHLKVPGTAPSDLWQDLRAQAEHDLMIRRRTGDLTAYEQAVMALSTAPEHVRQALLQSSGKAFYQWPLQAVAVAAKYVVTREQFERLVGLYEHGYPSQFRSDVMFWGWRFIRKAEKISFSQYRRALRWLFRALSEGKAIPALAGNIDPSESSA